MTDSKDRILCVTFASLFSSAQTMLKKQFPDAQSEILDLKALVLSPRMLLQHTVKRKTIAIGLLPDIETGEALDLIGSVLFLLNASRKYTLDLDGRTLPVTARSGIGHILRCLRDILAMPLFISFFLLRGRVLLRRANRPREISWPEIAQKTFAYFRTDTFGELNAGGSVAHTVGVLKGFMLAGFTPIYISPHPIRPVVSLNITLETIRRSSWFRNIPEFPLMLYSEQLFSGSKKLFLPQNISLIYQRYSLNNYAGVLHALKWKIPFILEYNGSDVWIARNWGVPLRFEKIGESIEMANLLAATLIIVVSRPMKDELISRGINADKILVNPNGVDPDQYSPEVNGSDIRRHHHVEEKLVIGFIGTFGRWHGAEVLAEAFGRLIRSFPEYREKVRLFMIGDGLTMPQVKENLAKYNVMDICVLTGRIPQEQGPSHLAACDILASPHVPNPDGTPFFGSPTKLFEYMAMGKGIVASDLDQIGEILEHDKTAWMVKPGDAESLMLGLKILIDDRQLRERLGKAARSEVAKYTWKEHTRKIIDKLREVVQTE